MEPQKVTKKLRDLYRLSCGFSHSIKSISAKLRRVERWYAVDDMYYNSGANLYLVLSSLSAEVTLARHHHLSVETNAKSGPEYFNTARQKIETASPHNLLQNLVTRCSSIRESHSPMDERPLTPAG